MDYCIKYNIKKLIIFKPKNIKCLIKAIEKLIIFKTKNIKCLIKAVMDYDVKKIWTYKFMEH